VLSSVWITIDAQDRQWLDAEEMVGSRERDQPVSDRSRPVAPAAVSGRARAALWGLRVLVLIVGAMVIYTFFARL
jgi:hypothetical protein